MAEADHPNAPIRKLVELPSETRVDVTKRQAFHTNRRWMHQSQPSAVSARPCRTNVGITERNTCHENKKWMSPSAKSCVKDGV